MFNFDYTVSSNNDKAAYINVCKVIEREYPELTKEKELIDVDGTTIQQYKDRKTHIAVFNDYEVGAVFVKANINLNRIY